VAQPLLELQAGEIHASSRIFCTVARTDRRIADQPALQGGALPRQHFLKQDAVFFDVLVYSGCSAFRFSGARSEHSHLTTTEGNMAKKAKKAKKAKSAVKKTAKKTRKVKKK
jgi:hypothetical protein